MGGRRLPPALSLPPPGSLLSDVQGNPACPETATITGSLKLAQSGRAWKCPRLPGRRPCRLCGRRIPKPRPLPGLGSPRAVASCCPLSSQGCPLRSSSPPPPRCRSPPLSPKQPQIACREVPAPSRPEADPGLCPRRAPRRRPARSANVASLTVGPHGSHQLLPLQRLRASLSERALRGRPGPACPHSQHPLRLAPESFWLRRGRVPASGFRPGPAKYRTDLFCPTLYNLLSPSCPTGTWEICQPEPGAELGSGGPGMQTLRPGVHTL